MKKQKKEKLTRKQRKELLSQQKALEKQLVAEGRIPARVRYAPRSFLWNVIAVCLAFFFGILATLGALIGAGVFAGTKMKVKDVISLAGVEYEELIAEDYADMTLLDLATELKNTRFTTLNSVGKYTPLLKAQLDKVNEQLLVLGVHLDTAELMNVEFSQMGSYFQENVLKKAVIGEMLGLSGDSQSLMLAVCYGAEGIDYTVAEDGAIVMNEGKSALTVGDLSEDASTFINRIYIEDFLSVNANSQPALRYLAYGAEGERYKIENGEVVMLENPATGETYLKKTLSSLTEENGDLLDDARIGDLVDVSGSDGLLSAIADWKVSYLKDSYRIERLKISQVLDANASSSLIMRAIGEWRIGELSDQSKIDSLALGDVLDIDENSPAFLLALKNTPIGALNDAVNGLRLADILSEEELAGNKLLKHLKNSTLDSLSSDVEQLKMGQVFGDELYSYMVFEGKTYDELALQYAQIGKDDATLSGIVPEEIGHDATVEQKLFVNGTTVREGYFMQKDGAYELCAESDVLSDGNGYYVLTRQPLTPVTEWKIVDYALKGLSPLPAGDAVTNRDGTLVYETAEGTAYPLSQDGYGAYCYRYDESGKRERIDFEETVTGYRYEDGGTAVALTVAGGGKVTADDGTVYTVFRQPEIDGETGYEYIKIRKEAVKKYYAPLPETDVYQTVYEENEVTVKYYATWTEEGVTRSDVEVDRYLSGIWYLLFNGDGDAVNEIPVLEINEQVSATTERLNSTPLWELYFHGLLESNPYAEIAYQTTEKTFTNLNQLTIAEVVRFAKYMLSNP